MKVTEHPPRAATEVWFIFSEDGRRGCTAIRYKDGGMEVIPQTAGTSCGSVPKCESHKWARRVAADYFARDSIADAKRNLDNALVRYQKVVAEMPPAKVQLVAVRKD